MRIFFVILVSSIVSSAAAQAPDPKQSPETVKVISETKESVDKGSTTTTKRISPVIPCDLDIPACQDKLQSVTKSNVQSYYQAKVQIGDVLYTINGKSGGPGVPFGTFKARITNQYMEIYIVDQNGPYVLGFEIVGAEKTEAEPSPTPIPASTTQGKPAPTVEQDQPNHGDAMHDGLWICLTPASTISLDSNLAETSRSGIKLTRTVIEQLVQQNGNCKRLDADNIKPVGFFPEASYSIVKVSDGKQEGWTSLDMYVTYMQVHVVRKPEAASRP